MDPTVVRIVRRRKVSHTRPLSLSPFCVHAAPLAKTLESLFRGFYSSKGQHDRENAIVAIGIEEKKKRGKERKREKALR